MLNVGPVCDTQRAKAAYAVCGEAYPFYVSLGHLSGLVPGLFLGVPCVKYMYRMWKAPILELSTNSTNMQAIMVTSAS